MRIVSLQPSISIILAALGRTDALCACTKYCFDAVPELSGRGLPVVHDSWTAIAAELQMQRPNLVVACVPYRIESLAAILKAGLPVLALAPRTLADIFQDIYLLSDIVNARDEAQSVVGRMTVRIAEMQRMTAASERPIVYCEEWGKPMIHSQAWVAELVEAAGGRFLGTPGAQTTVEQVAAADPDVLVLAWCGAGDRVPLAQIVAQRAWHHLQAVRQGRVYCIPDELLNTPAPSLMEGLACLGAAIHPELFAYDARMVQLGCASRRIDQA